MGSLVTLIAFLNTQEKNVADDEPVVQLFFSGISAEVVKNSYGLKPEVSFIVQFSNTTSKWLFNGHIRGK